MVTYEAQTNNRWVFDLERADSFLANAISIKRLKRKSCQITIDYYVSRGSDQNRQFHEWLLTDEKRRGVMKLIDTLGQINERWDFVAKPKSLILNPLSYGDKSPTMVRVVISAKKLKISSIGALVH